MDSFVIFLKHLLEFFQPPGKIQSVQYGWTVSVDLGLAK